jgi:hypothetical protein
MRKILPYLIIAVGECLIIWSFFQFGFHLEPNIFNLDLIICSVIYLLFFAHLLFPWVNFQDKAQKSIGSLGIRWVVTFMYACFAIIAMLYMHHQKVTFTSQLLLQSVFVFFLLIGLYGSVASSDKVGQIHQEEQKNRAQLDSLRKLAQLIKVQVESNSTIDKAVKAEFIQFEESLRFISPSNQSEAWDLESELISQLQNFKNQMGIENNAPQLNAIISTCNQLYKIRKQTLSN